MTRIPAARFLFPLLALIIMVPPRCAAQDDLDQYTAGDEFQVLYPHGWVFIDDAGFITKRLKQSGTEGGFRPLVVFGNERNDIMGAVGKIPNPGRETLDDIIMAADRSAPSRGIEVVMQKDTGIAGRRMAIRLYESTGGRLMLFAIVAAREAVYQYQYECSSYDYDRIGLTLQACVASLRVDRKAFASPRPVRDDSLRAREQQALARSPREQDTQASDSAALYSGGFGRGFLHGLLFPYNLVALLFGSETAATAVRTVTTAYDLNEHRMRSSSSYYFGLVLGFLLMLGILRLLKEMFFGISGPRTAAPSTLPTAPGSSFATAFETKQIAAAECSAEGTIAGTTDEAAGTREGSIPGWDAGDTGDAGPRDGRP